MTAIMADQNPKAPRWRFRGDTNRYAYPGAVLNLEVPAFSEATIALMDEEVLPFLGRRTAFDCEGTLLWQDLDGAVLARVPPITYGLYELPEDSLIVLDRVR